MIKKLIKAQFRLEFDWFSWIILLLPLYGFAVLPLTMMYGLLLPNFTQFRTNKKIVTELYITLPVQRKDVLKSQVLYFVLWQVLYCTVFALDILINFLLSRFTSFNWDPNRLYSKWILPANLAQLGILLFGMGLRNMLGATMDTLPDVNSLKQLLCLAVALALPWGLNVLAARFASNYFGNYDLHYLWVRLLTVAVGLAAFGGMTYIGYRLKLKRFETPLQNFSKSVQ